MVVGESRWKVQTQSRRPEKTGTGSSPIGDVIRCLTGRDASVFFADVSISSSQNERAQEHDDKESLTKENLKNQEKLCREAERRSDEDKRQRERSEQTYRSSPPPSRQPSQQTSRRPSEQPTFRLFAPLSHELPSNPTPRYLIREGFSPIDSNKKSQDRYRSYTTETVGSKLIEVRDTVGIPSKKR